jgi:hypothetical protein
MEDLKTSFFSMAINSGIRSFLMDPVLRAEPIKN